jgi:hypothetical protein
MSRTTNDAIVSDLSVWVTKPEDSIVGAGSSLVCLIRSFGANVALLFLDESLAEELRERRWS